MKRIGLILLPIGMMVTAAVLALFIMQSFGSTPCTQGQAGDQPPPEGATAFAKLGPSARATFLAGEATFWYINGQTMTAQPPEIGIVTPGVSSLTDQNWIVVYPEGISLTPEGGTPAAVGGLTSLSGC